MEITENERLLLIKKREELCTVTQELSDLLFLDNDTRTKQEILEIEKKVLKISCLLQILSTYMISDYDTQQISNKMFRVLNENIHDTRIFRNVALMLSAYCFTINNIHFRFSRWPQVFRAKIANIGELGIE